MEEFYYLDIPSKKISSEIQDRVFRKLQMLDDSSSEADLRSPPSNHFEKLVGRLNGKFSIRVKKMAINLSSFEWWGSKQYLFG
ncbi:MAG: type II toxin-antitoxin system RelE/ParE family toxin [Litorivicinaceae bacterium]